MSNPEDQKVESAAKNVEVEDADTPVEEVSAECNPELSQKELVDNGDGVDDPVSDDVEVETETLPTVESLKVELENAAVEVSKFKDVALRAEAEMQNVRRRASTDLEKAHKYGLDRFVQNLLPVIDSLEKAVDAAEQVADEGTNKAIVDGVGLCHKMLVDVLGKEGVTVVEPLGEPFDPNLHEAVLREESAEIDSEMVVEELQKGFVFRDRLLRPAMVKVAVPIADRDRDLDGPPEPGEPIPDSKKD